MRNTRVAAQALRLASDTPHHAHICRACSAQSTRALSTSSSLRASHSPFFKRLENTLHGSKESKAAEAAREAARQKRLEQIKEDGPIAERQTFEAWNGKVYEVADIVDPTTHEDYAASSNWKGLEWIGGVEWVKKRMDGGEVYTGFMPSKHAKLDFDEWETLLHTVATEVLTLQKAKRDVLQVCNARRISPKAKEAVVDLKMLEKRVLESIPETSEDRVPGALEAELKEALASGGGNALMGMKLNDPRVKFAISTRTMQLTGNRIPDILISSAKTLAQLHFAFAAKEAPKKLHDTEELQALQDVGNVTVHESRRTHVHRDKEIGRWKLIEDEMNARGMPLRGRSMGIDA